MKRFICILLTSMIVLTAFVGCIDADIIPDTTDGTTASDETDGTTTITTTANGEYESNTDEETTTSIITDVQSYINPVFSVDGGIYTNVQTLTLSLPEGCNPNYVIRYTTNGDEPTSRSTKYSNPIRLLAGSDSQVIRAACFNSRGTIQGRIITNTYIKNSSAGFGIWTISITAENDDYQNMVDNFTKSIEIPANAEMITPDGEKVISQNVGLKVFGGSSRSLGQKSFKLTARKDGYFNDKLYNGKGSMSYPLFPDRIIESGIGAGSVLAKYDSIVLRNGGNDSLHAAACEGMRSSLLRDSLSNRFASRICDTFDYANSQFCRVYVNGEFYGILDMRENMNDNYVKNVYGVDDDMVSIIKSELNTNKGCRLHETADQCRYCGTWFFYECDESSELKAWKNLVKEFKNVDAYNHAEKLALLEKNVDIDSFLEYMAINLYLCNTDWPHNNVKLWRYTSTPIEGIDITDGKYRFMYRDMDFTFARYVEGGTAELKTTADVDMFYRTLGNYIDYGYENEGFNTLYADALGLQAMLHICLMDEGYRTQFYELCLELASDASRATLTSLLDEVYNEAAPHIGDHLERWEYSSIPSEYSMESYAQARADIQSFIDERPALFLSHLEKMMRHYN